MANYVIKEMPAGMGNGYIVPPKCQIHFRGEREAISPPRCLLLEGNENSSLMLIGSGHFCRIQGFLSIF